MKLQGAVVKEQGVTFAIVVVKRHVIQNRSTARKSVRNFATVFPGMPVILMAQDSHGTPTFYGRKDIVRYLSNVSLDRIPWKEYTLT